MAIGTCGELKTAIQGWLKRDDLAPNMLDFIALAEARIARELRPLRQITQTTLSASAGSGLVALPTDWLETVRIRLVLPDTELEYISPQQMVAAYRLADRGTPVAFTMEGPQLRLAPVPDADVTLDVSYHARLPALAADDSTTWLLQQHPGIYLWSALSEASPFVLDDARAMLWEQKAKGEMLAFATADDRGAHSGSTLRIRRG
jgi:hypothetical protein